jgi:hypothetical protein
MMREEMKSALALVIVVVMVLVTFGCGGEATDQADGAVPDTAVPADTVAPADTAAPAEPAVAPDEEEETGDWRELKLDEKRGKIDDMADAALAGVLDQSDRAKRAHDSCVGYAVLDNLKIALLISGGGGTGVAVNKASGERTYMKMGTGGVGFGLGGQKYQVILMFEDDATYNNFVDNGWKADASAQSAAGTAGANVVAGFVDGIAIFQVTEGGLMANADISGTRYWKYKKLNK